MNRKNKIISILCAFIVSNCANTPKDIRPEVEVLKMNNQIDKYSYLEDVEGEKALNWVRAQNQRSLDFLHKDPIYNQFEAESVALIKAADRLSFDSYQNGYISNFWQDDKQIRGVWRRSDFASWQSNNPKWETILDLDKLSADEGKNWVFKGSECLNPNDKWNSICLLSLSDGGKDANIKREFDIKTKSFVQNGFYLPEAKSSISWVDKDNILVATDWGKGTLTESGYPFVVKLLKRGQKLDDATEVFSAEKTDVSAGTYHIDDGEKFHRFFYKNPTFFTTETFYQDENGAIKQLNLPSKHSIIGIKDGQLYFSNNEDWQNYTAGSLLSAPIIELLGHNKLNITQIYKPADREAFQGASFSKNALLVEITKNVKSEIRNYQKSENGWNYTKIILPENGVASIASIDIRDENIFYSYNDFTTPPSILYSKTANSAPETVQSQPSRFDASDLIFEQHEAKSKDGTMVPFFVVHKKGIKYDGNTPTLLYGYGGFEVSLLPNYSASLGKLWLERGGAYILANIRGGGELGPKWHDAGLKTNRQVIYDDFIAVAEYAISHKLTSPRRLGIMGGSNGGLLMGVMLTQRPELFNAVVVQVPLLDMLNYHKLLAGASWVDEYGNPDIPNEREWLEKMSPYQNLRKRNHFPEPFLVTSTKDDRVHPAHARKYAAKMEGLGMPFLYYENIDGGHSAAANLVEGAKRRALEYVYLKQKLMD